MLTASSGFVEHPPVLRSVRRLYKSSIVLLAKKHFACGFESSGKCVPVKNTQHFLSYSTILSTSGIWLNSSRNTLYSDLKRVLNFTYLLRSRLGCQIMLSKDLDGLEVHLPSSINDARQ